MMWFTVEPSADGYYWYRRSPGEYVLLLRIVLCDVNGTRVDRVYEFGDNTGHRPLRYYAGGQWAGPLAAPAG